MLYSDGLNIAQPVPLVVFRVSVHATVVRAVVNIIIISYNKSFYFLRVIFPSFGVRFVVRAVLLGAGSQGAVVHPVSAPSIFALAALISHPLSTRAHAQPAETCSPIMSCSHTGAPGLHQAPTDPVLVVLLPDYVVS